MEPRWAPAKAGSGVAATVLAATARQAGMTQRERERDDADDGGGDLGPASEPLGGRRVRTQGQLPGQHLLREQFAALVQVPVGGDEGADADRRDVDDRAAVFERA